MAAAQPPFRVRETSKASADVLEVEGELGLSTADLLGEALSEASGSVIVDLTGCSLVDSTGLALLLRAAQRFEQGSDRLAVVVRDPEIRRLFEITGIDMTVAVHASRDEALANLLETE
jgi:anti-anti-sigma factor